MQYTQGQELVINFDYQVPGTQTVLPKALNVEFIDFQSFNVARVETQMGASWPVDVAYLDTTEEFYQDELTKPLDCPVETPEEREWFERVESKMDSLSRRVDLILSNQSGGRI